jgi:hypothetical protein
MPAVPPYSSTTIARWRPPLRISVIAGSTCLLPGKMQDLAGEVRRRADRPVAIVGARMSRTCTNPTTSSGDSPITG